MEFWRFLHSNIDLGREIVGTHNHLQCYMSLVIAIVAALAMLPSIDRMTHATTRKAYLLWMTAGATVMAFGIWGMHFTAMLAFTMPFPITYDLPTTAASAIPAFLGCAIALRISVQIQGPWRVPAAALSLALGIGTMHYVGMEAIRTHAVMMYDPVRFLLSIVTAYALATIGLYSVFGLQKRLSGRYLPVLPGAIILGLAVTGMHFMAMSATHFYAAEAVLYEGVLIPTEILDYVIMTVCVLIVGILLIASVVDQRLSAISESLQESEARHRSVIETMLDGHVIADAKGIILSMNESAERIFGYQSEEVVGKNVKILMADSYAGRHDGFLVAPHLGRTGVLGRKREIDAGGRRKNGDVFPIELCTSPFRTSAGLFYSGIVRDITETRNVQSKNSMLVAAVESTAEAIVIMGTDGRVVYVNSAYTDQWGISLSEVIGKRPAEVHEGVGEDVFREIQEAIQTQGSWSGCINSQAADGESRTEEITVSPVRSEHGEVSMYIAVCRDVTEQQSLERQLNQAHKLEAIGQLAAGIAHEINTPSQYVGDNTRFLQNAFTDLGSLLDQLKTFIGRDEGTITKDELAKVLEVSDADYLQEEIPRAIEQSLEGIGRVSKIVRAMKEFSHPSQEKTPVNLNQAIDSTITVASNEWRYVANLETEFDSSMPMVECLPGDFNQVILNVLVNAAHAIGDVVADSGKKGTIRVSTFNKDSFVEIQIEDTGCGMPEEVSERIFDPFYTTKEVGRGTGQGLSIAYVVIVEKHGGEILVDSEPGRGTCFTIRIPIENSSADESPVAA